MAERDEILEAVRLGVRDAVLAALSSVDNPVPFFRHDVLEVIREAVEAAAPQWRD